jgi:hypothetical protein
MKQIPILVLIPGKDLRIQRFTAIEQKDYYQSNDLYNLPIPFSLHFLRMAGVGAALVSLWGRNLK